MADDEDKERDQVDDHQIAAVDQKFALAIDSGTIQELYAQGPDAVYRHCQKWATATAVKIIGDLPGMMSHDHVALVSSLARHAEAAMVAVHGQCPRSQLPQTPPGLSVVLGWSTINDPASLGIDCPKRLPRTAQLVAGLEWSWCPGCDCDAWFYITTNRTRKHWILWVDDPLPFLVPVFMREPGGIGSLADREGGA